MKKFFVIMLALLLCVSCAYAETAEPYFEEYDLSYSMLNDVRGFRLNEGFVFFDEANIYPYPCDIEYTVLSDETADGKRHMNIRMDVGMYQLPAVTSECTVCVYYALYDYYTGNQFFVEAEMNRTDMEMKDFTVEFGGEAYEISARVANTYMEYDGSSVVFVFEYELIMDEEYDGLMLCNAPIYDYSDYEDFKRKMDENADSGLPLIEDLGDLAYECVYVRVK